LFQKYHPKASFRRDQFQKYHSEGPEKVSNLHSTKGPGSIHFKFSRGTWGKYQIPISKGPEKISISINRRTWDTRKVNTRGIWGLPPASHPASVNKNTRSKQVSIFSFFNALIFKILLKLGMTNALSFPFPTLPFHHSILYILKST